MTKNIGAYTAPGCNYPEFISINEDTDLGYVTVIVRSCRDIDGNCGESAQIQMTRELFDLLIVEVCRKRLDLEVDK
jgi:hypothetical protein